MGAALVEAGHLTKHGERIIREFAERIGVSAGIVLGRLQFEGRIGWQQFNHLKVTYRWNHET